MTVRVQVLLDEHKQDLFRRQATLDGVSLSTWLKQAGHLRLAHGQRASNLDSSQALQAFFAECDHREQGREPDWEEHISVIRRSQTEGLADT
jgi:hypothetical protein